MGRNRKEGNENLPKGMAEKNGRYYFVTTTVPRKWIPLGRLFGPALKHYQNLLSQSGSDLVRPAVKAASRRTTKKPMLKEGEATKRSIEHEAKRLLSRTNINAKARSIPVEITIEDVIFMLKRSNGRCEVTGIEFDYTWESKNWKSRPWVPSIDRKHNGKGYSLSNCQIVCHAANRAMGEWKMEIFHKMCTSYASTKILVERPSSL